MTIAFYVACAVIAVGIIAWVSATTRSPAAAVAVVAVAAFLLACVELGRRVF